MARVRPACPAAPRPLAASSRRLGAHTPAPRLCPPPPPQSPRTNTPSAIVVTLVATAIIPLALKPGDDAAQKLFAAKQKAPLDKKANNKGRR